MKERITKKIIPNNVKSGTGSIPGLGVSLNINLKIKSENFVGSGSSVSGIDISPSKINTKMYNTKDRKSIISTFRLRVKNNSYNEKIIKTII